MELQISIATGTAAGLTASLLLMPVWKMLSQRGTSESAGKAAWRMNNSRTEILYIGAHALSGAAQGALFWLSWGFAALVSVPWWWRGLSVGGGYVLLLTLPLLAMSASVLRISKLQWLVLIVEALVTSMAVGLACSWNWAHSF